VYWQLPSYLPYFVLFRIDLLLSAVQDAKTNYLIQPPKTKTIDAAGSTITYGKNSSREYVYIPGPINQNLRFMVRNEMDYHILLFKMDLKYFGSFGGYMHRYNVAFYRITDNSFDWKLKEVHEAHRNLTYSFKKLLSFFF